MQAWGILISRRLVLTCAHVVNHALEREHDSQEQPLEKVQVTFPLLDNVSAIGATVIAWHPMRAPSAPDMALLELAVDAPEEAGIAILAQIHSASLANDLLRVFGFAGSTVIGTWVDARLKGNAGASYNHGLITQLRNDENSDPIVPGFSGAALWDQVRGSVVGMVTAAHKAIPRSLDEPVIADAYAIPVATMRRLSSHIDVEDRTLTRFFPVIYAAVAIASFILVFEHLQTVNSGNSLFGLVLAKRHNELAAYWGMLLYAVLWTVLSIMFYFFARDFRLHSWEYRVPTITGTRASHFTPLRKVFSVLTLILIFALPLAFQVHFLRRFHDQGDVFIYTDNDFGVPVNRMYDCMGTLCRYEEAGRYSLLTPIPPKLGAYWNNAYHYGWYRPEARSLSNDKKESGQTVQYYPILIPVLVIALTLLSSALIFGILVSLFKPDWARRLGLMPRLRKRDFQSDVATFAP